MSWESHPWKVDLYKRAAWLKAKKAEHCWPESASVLVETCVMVGCYCTRKLVEAGKLTDVVVRRQMPAIIYKARDKTVHSMTGIIWRSCTTLRVVRMARSRSRSSAISSFIASPNSMVSAKMAG